MGDPSRYPNYTRKWKVRTGSCKPGTGPWRPTHERCQKIALTRGIPYASRSFNLFFGMYLVHAFGHLTSSVFRRYAIVDEGMLHEGAEKLSAMLRGSKPRRKVVGLDPERRDD